MKKTIMIFAMGILMLVGAQSIAQEKGQIRAGLGLAMGTKAAINDTGGNKLGLGMNIGGDYFVIDKLSISPSFTSFFKSKLAATFLNLSVKMSSFNVDGKYYFLTDAVNVYGLLGVSFSTTKTTRSTPDIGDGPGPTNSDLKDNNTGINIGIGVDYELSDKLYLNGQIKYNTPLEQMVFNIGVGYVIK